MCTYVCMCMCISYVNKQNCFCSLFNFRLACKFCVRAFLLFLFLLVNSYARKQFFFFIVCVCVREFIIISFDCVFCFVLYYQHFAFALSLRTGEKRKRQRNQAIRLNCLTTNRKHIYLFAGIYMYDIQFVFIPCYKSLVWVCWVPYNLYNNSVKL